MLKSASVSVFSLVPRIQRPVTGEFPVRWYKQCKIFLPRKGQRTGHRQSSPPALPGRRTRTPRGPPSRSCRRGFCRCQQSLPGWCRDDLKYVFIMTSLHSLNLPLFSSSIEFCKDKSSVEPASLKIRTTSRDSVQFYQEGRLKIFGKILIEIHEIQVVTFRLPSLVSTPVIEGVPQVSLWKREEKVF